MRLCKRIEWFEERSGLLGGQILQRGGVWDGLVGGAGRG